MTDLSHDEETFHQATHLYNEALHASGYEEDVEYKSERNERRNKKRRNHQRNITWFNPPFSKNVPTNVAGKFFHLIDKHFPKGSPLNKVFNRNTVKVSIAACKIYEALSIPIL